MEIADIVIQRIEETDNPKKPYNTLVCFSLDEMGIAISKLNQLLIGGKQNKLTTTTLLNLLDEKDADKIEDEHIYRANLLSKIMGEQDGGDKSTVRTFVKHSDNFVDEITKTAEEQNCDFILWGIGPNVFNSPIWEKYKKLKENSLANEEDYIKELGQCETKTLRITTNLFNKSDKTVGVLVGAGFNIIKNVFVPILKKEDISIFTYINQIAKNPNVNIIVWDAIGIIENNNKIQKIFSSISKKAEGKFKLWNNNNKISTEFMNEQDLMLIAHSGWEKLINTPLCWINNMPSTLIIKDKKR